jgi:hypothetical protein
MNIAELHTSISSLADVELNEIETSVATERAARIAKRDADLPAYPSLVAINGHTAPIQVDRTKALELLHATPCNHRLATPEELGAA